MYAATMSVVLLVPLNPRSKRMFFVVFANSENLGAIFLIECDSNSRTRHSLLRLLYSGRDVIVLPIVIKSAGGCLAKISSPN